MIALMYWLGVLGGLSLVVCVWASIPLFTKPKIKMWRYALSILALNGIAVSALFFIAALRGATTW